MHVSYAQICDFYKGLSVGGQCYSSYALSIEKSDNTVRGIRVIFYAISVSAF